MAKATTPPASQDKPESAGGAPDADAAAAAAAEAERAPESVRMVRDPELYEAPHEADVHVDEVDNYRPGGWELA
ncbi:hypothetical protein BKK79_19970 [Cupriavidus sp. USMAA2-4]|uniref:hypothetical protein n=1 Tax=Cupriavidus sp. USMAA2-4 TaxID=876364 RepID=UPI0008A6E30F|nr:hypothetical protein [Cupriavidus sp. USMAA2-4]AOY93825.1 hypothetical protein BKK79_19970 [Cupriavidus sp. USMAA2-4]